MCLYLFGKWLDISQDDIYTLNHLLKSYQETSKYLHLYNLRKIFYKIFISLILIRIIFLILSYMELANVYCDYCDVRCNIY